MSEIHIPVSYGELIDKITILEIKQARISDPAKQANVAHELALLQAAWSSSGAAAQSIADLREALKAVNEALWEIEDAIRDKERAQSFDAGSSHWPGRFTTRTISVPPSSATSTCVWAPS